MCNVQLCIYTLLRWRLEAGTRAFEFRPLPRLRVRPIISAEGARKLVRPVSKLDDWEGGEGSHIVFECHYSKIIRGPFARVCETLDVVASRFSEAALFLRFQDVDLSRRRPVFRSNFTNSSPFLFLSRYTEKKYLKIYFT